MNIFDLNKFPKAMQDKHTNENSLKLAPLLYFFSICGGSDVDVLKKCSKYEQNRYAAIGAAVFFTGIMAWVSGGYAIYRIFYFNAVNINALYFVKKILSKS